MFRPGKEVYRLHLFGLIPVLYQPAGVAGGGGGVAAYHDHRARGHGGDGCQRGFVAAFARRVNDDDIGARTLGGQLG